MAATPSAIPPKLIAWRSAPLVNNGGAASVEDAGGAAVGALALCRVVGAVVDLGGRATDEVTTMLLLVLLEVVIEGVVVGAGGALEVS